MSTPVLRLKDSDGNIIPIPAIKGEKGDNYILTKADREEIAKLSKTFIDQTYSPESENAQSGIAIEERLKGKVLLDVTLTEEQAGATSVMVAIPNYELLKKAKLWNIRITYPYSGTYNANTLWHNLVLCNENKNSYNICLANGYNTAYSESSKVASFLVTVFNTPFDYREGGGSFISYYMPPACWITVSSANSGTNVRTNADHYFSYVMSEQIPPYLEFQTGGITLEAGTRIYLEVIL